MVNFGDFDTSPVTEIQVRDIRLEEFQDFNRIFHKDLLSFVKESRNLNYLLISSENYSINSF